jgi:hypothetical protein
LEKGVRQAEIFWNEARQLTSNIVQLNNFSFENKMNENDAAKISANPGKMSSEKLF